MGEKFCSQNTKGETAWKIGSILQNIFQKLDVTVFM